MTDRARRVGENLRSRGGRAIGGGLTGPSSLMLDPLVEILGRIDEDAKAHVGVRIAAELGALPVIFAGNVGLQSYLVSWPGTTSRLPPIAGMKKL